MEGIQIFDTRVGARGDIALLIVRGYVDTTTSSELHKKIIALLEGEIFQLIVDLGAVNYVSSAGWGVLVGEIRGIRENGGDLKIVHMLPNVYEVFQMLEFHRILLCYETIEEAMNDFDISMGLDITQSRYRGTVSLLKEEFQATRPSTRPVHGVLKPRSTHSKTPEDEGTLPLTEKIKTIVTENPMGGVWKIRKALFSSRFGYTKVNWFKLRSLLRKLNLETKEKRYRYYRSR